MASTNDKKKKTTYTTPKGELLFAHIVDVDYGTEQYPCKEGRFRVTLCLFPAEAEALRRKMSDEIAAAEDYAAEKFSNLKPATQKKLGNLRFNEVGEEEFNKEGEPTGRIKFSFKTNAFVERRDGSKVQRKVPLYDSMAQPAKLSAEPGNGTEAKISFTCSPYFVEGTGTGGLTMWLNAVMITKLVKYGERSASDYGFEADEDGDFSAESTAGEASTTTDFDRAVTSGSEQTDGDF